MPLSIRRAAIAAMVASATVTAGCRAAARRLYHPPTVELRNVAVDRVDITGGLLRVALMVRNPNPYALSSAGMQYRLLVGDSVPIASGVDSTHRRIGANDSTIIELPVTVNWQGLSAAGRAIAESGLVPYQLIGTVRLDTPIGTRDIPVNQRGSFRPAR